MRGVFGIELVDPLFDEIPINVAAEDATQAFDRQRASADEQDRLNHPRRVQDGRTRRFHLLLDAYGYTGDRTAIRDAIIGRVERNVAMIRQFADGGEPTFQRMLPWAADLERSGNEVAELPDEFWQRPLS